MPEDTTPKIQIDSDWKAEAQAEKERLAEKEKKAAPGGKRVAPSPDELPEASFRTLVGMLASQALMGLGTLQDPQTKGIVVDLEGARFSIDLLGVVEEKTAGNLTDEEAKELGQLLAELRSRFVQVTNLIARSAAAGSAGTGAAPSGFPGPIQAS